MKPTFNNIFIKAFRAQQSKIRPYMSSIGLTPGQPKILEFLASNNHCMQKDLACACDIEPATVSSLLNNMEREGLIERTSIKGNKRALSISITDKGREYHEKMQIHFREVNAMALIGFTDEEKKQLSKYLCRIYMNLTGMEI